MFVRRQALVPLLVTFVASCGGSTDTVPPGDGGAGLGGSAGTLASGGGGGGGMGAASGGPPPQCTNASQCQLFSDCCSCVAVGPNEVTPPMCPDPCVQDACAALGVGGSSVQCVVGQCVAGIQCNVLDVFCNAPMPQCPVGKRPAVVNHCWGPCVPVNECQAAMSCADCATPKQICVTEGDVITRHCVDVPAECGQGVPTCACMGKSVCIPPYSVCHDALPGDPDGTSIKCLMP
ncbi:MAG: hypothetical protein U0263_21710 [Polyangiaceae bacterium]